MVPAREKVVATAWGGGIRGGVGRMVVNHGLCRGRLEEMGNEDVRRGGDGPVGWLVF